MTNSVYITATGIFLPHDPVANDDMERILGQVGERPSRARRMILRSNGIKSRHYAVDSQTLQPTFTNAALTAQAVRALSSAFDLAQLECLVCGTSLPDQLFPNHASMVQGELALPALEATATSGVCLSGLASLRYAYLSVLSGQHRNAVATGSELSSALMRAHNFQNDAPDESDARLAELEKAPEIAFEKDFLRWMLSDGAGAFLLEPTPRSDRTNLRIDWIEMRSYAGEMEPCMYAGAIKRADGGLDGWAPMTKQQRAESSVLTVTQDVKLLNESVIAYTLEKPLRDVIAKYKLRTDDIDYFVPHYSSEYFRDRVETGLRNVDFPVPQQRWFTNLTRKGNTGSASIYIMLDELLTSGDLRSGQKLLCWVPESGRFSGGLMHLTVV
ncbi:MAG: beta-ketoacyl-ACP synthase III [Spongiibacteraceae bacterium]